MSAFVSDRSEVIITDKEPASFIGLVKQRDFQQLNGAAVYKTKDLKSSERLKGF